MKCPKCNYISFDYNQTCPKCKKDLAESRGRMNHPSFRPSPLSISSIKGPTETVRMEQKKVFVLEEKIDLKSSAGQNLDKAEEPDMDFSLEAASDELSLDFDGLEMDDDPPVTPQKQQIDGLKEPPDADMDFSFDDESEDLSLNFDEPASDAAPEAPQMEQQIFSEESIEKKLDMAFMEEDGSDTDLQLTESDQVTAAFDLGELTIDEQGEDTPSELEVLDLDLDLEKLENPDDI